MENDSRLMTERDTYFALFAGLLIGLLMLPITWAAKPELFNKIFWVIIPVFLIGTPFGLYVASLIAKKIAVIWQIAKFGVTGVLNFLVDLGLLSLLIFLFQKYLAIDSKTVIFQFIGIVIAYFSIFKATSFIVANINSYLWNKYWTFKDKTENKSSGQFAQFFLVSIIGFVVNVVVASYVFKAIPPLAGFSTAQWALMGAAAGSIMGLVWNFIGYKFIVFKN